MSNDRAICNSTEHRQDSLADKLSALFGSRVWSTHMDAHKSESGASKSARDSDCQQESSPFALPRLEISEPASSRNSRGATSSGNLVSSLDAVPLRAGVALRDSVPLRDEAPSLELPSENFNKSIAILQNAVGSKRVSENQSHLALLPQVEKDEFVHSLVAILDSDSKKFEVATRKLIVSEIIDQVDHPEKIKQGYKGTCGLASVEVDIAASHPDVYARAVERWSKLVDTSAPGSRDTVSEALHNPNVIIDRDDKSHHRTLVSRIFQTGAVNLMLAGTGKRYENFSPSEAPAIKTPDGSFKPDHDTGERIIDSSGKVLTWDGVSAEEQAALLTRLSAQKFIPDRIYPGSPDDLAAKLKAELMKSDIPINMQLHSVLGDHAITVLKVGDQKQPTDVFYLNTATSEPKVLRISAQKLFDATIDGDDVVRIGSAQEIDGLTFRKAYKLPVNAKPFVSVVHAAEVR
jgi:hypothetical protein